MSFVCRLSRKQLMRKKTLLFAVNLCRFRFSIFFLRYSHQFSFLAVRCSAFLSFAFFLSFYISQAIHLVVLPMQPLTDGLLVCVVYTATRATSSIYSSDVVRSCRYFDSIRILCFVVKIKYMVVINKHELGMQPS